MEHDQAILLFIICLGALLTPILSRRVGVPAVVGEILFGILIANCGLGFCASGPWLKFLADFGFLMLMFLAGMEIDFNKLERQGKASLVISFLILLLTFALSYFFVKRLGFGFYMALVLSTTSVGLVIPTLRDIGLTKTDLGQQLILTALIVDFATLLAITIFNLSYKFGFNIRIFEFVFVFLFTVVVLVGLKKFVWWQSHRLAGLFGKIDPSELGVRVCFVLLFGFVAVASLFEVEMILGAFLAGAIFSMVFRERGALEDKMYGFGYGFLIPVFFIYVGITFDLQAIFSGQMLKLFFLLLLAALLVKLIPSFLFLLRRFSFSQSLSSGFLFSARLSLIIAAAAIGQNLGIIDSRVNSTIILLAMVTSSISPVLFRLLYPKEPAVEEVRE